MAVPHDRDVRLDTVRTIPRPAVPLASARRTPRPVRRSRVWAAVGIALAVLSCAASLAWMLTAPTGYPDTRPSASALREVNQRLLLGGLGALTSVLIGLLGILYWPRHRGLRVRRPAPAVSTYDSMTGLPTQRLFHLLLAQALARAAHTGRAVAVMAVEVGQCVPQGTAPSPCSAALVVRVAAARIKSALQSQDALARLGEWRFALMLDDLEDPARALAVAREIQAVIGLPLKVEGQELLLSCRIGGIVAPFDDTEPAALLDTAARLLTDRQGHDASILFVCDPTSLLAAAQPSAPSDHAAASTGR